MSSLLLCRRRFMFFANRWSHFHMFVWRHSKFLNIQIAVLTCCAAMVGSVNLLVGDVVDEYWDRIRICIDSTYGCAPPIQHPIGIIRYNPMVSKKRLKTCLPQGACCPLRPPAHAALHNEVSEVKWRKWHVLRAKKKEETKECQNKYSIYLFVGKLRYFVRSVG